MKTARVVLVALLSGCVVDTSTIVSAIAHVDSDAALSEPDVVAFEDAADPIEPDAGSGADAGGADASVDAAADVVVDATADAIVPTDAAVEADAETAIDAASSDAAVEPDAAPDSSVPTDAGCSRLMFRDGDGDGYGSSAAPIVSCVPVAGYVARSGDCYDSNRDARPSAPLQWHTTDRGDGSFDWDCDGIETLHWTALSPCFGPDGVGGPAGWANLCLASAGGVCTEWRGAPACGVLARRITETGACPARGIDIVQDCH
jgi:hypothetical protein